MGSHFDGNHVVILRNMNAIILPHKIVINAAVLERAQFLVFEVSDFYKRAARRAERIATR